MTFYQNDKKDLCGPSFFVCTNGTMCYNNHGGNLMTVSLKNNRIDIRVDDINKETLERAAQIKNLSLTAYITSVCLKK